MTKAHQEHITETIGKGRLISFSPVIKMAVGTTNAALLLNQLLYWWDTGKYKDVIYKTIQEIYEETSLTRSEQDSAIALLINLNLIEVELKGYPAKRYFHLNMDEIEFLVHQVRSVRVCGKSTKGLR